MVTKDRIRYFFSNIGFEITDDTRFFDDLQVTGLDADMLLDQFSKEFCVDMTSFKYENYFDKVPIIPFGQYFRKVFKSKPKDVLRLEDLVKIVDNGKWPAS